MREHLFDIALIILGSLAVLASWCLLNHFSDRRILRRLLPRTFNFPRALTHDETVAERSLRVALIGILVLVIGAILLMSGILRLFDIGRG